MNLNLCYTSDEEYITKYTKAVQTLRTHKIAVKLEEYYVYLQKLLSYAEKHYLNTWIDLGLHTTNDVWDATLEILGDKLFSRFFTLRNGVIVCDTARIRIAYNAVTNYYKAYAAVQAGVANMQQRQLASDITYQCIDEDAQTDLKTVYTFARYLELFGDSTVNYQNISNTAAADVPIAIQLEMLYQNMQRTKTLPEIKWLGNSKILKYISEFAYFYIDSTATTYRIVNDNNVDILLEILKEYISTPVLETKYFIQNMFYTGVDTKVLNANYNVLLQNSPLYFNGKAKNIIADLKDADLTILMDELHTKQVSNMGKLLTLIKEHTKMRINYIDTNEMIYTVAKTVVLPKEIQSKSIQVKKPTFESVFAL
jgi:hypothetical protein